MGIRGFRRVSMSTRPRKGNVCRPGPGLAVPPKGGALGARHTRGCPRCPSAMGQRRRLSAPIRRIAAAQLDELKRSRHPAHRCCRLQHGPAALRNIIVRRNDVALRRLDNRLVIKKIPILCARAIDMFR